MKSPDLRATRGKPLFDSNTIPFVHTARVNTLYRYAGLIGVFFSLAAHAETSDLWGANGEHWTPQSRLPDFSYAGYHCGEAPIPNVPPGVSVKTFGAKGDGVADDTAAFLKAINEAKGAIEIPPGRYLITDILEIKRSGIVLRGAGPDKTILFFPKPLQTIRPLLSATTEGRPTSEYSWAGGLIWLKGKFGERTLATISAEAHRGDQSVEVSSTENYASASASKSCSPIMRTIHWPPSSIPATPATSANSKPPLAPR